MYEAFGAAVQGSSVEFRLFFPDAAIDPTQYVRGGTPSISSIRVAGDFQRELGQQPWDFGNAPALARQQHPNGRLYTFRTPHIADGFYQYKYFVEFANGTTRWCGDPCSKYGGEEHENSGFVVGGNSTAVRPIAARLPLKDLVLYEVMVDDFTAGFRGGRAPFDAFRDRLDYLQDLGVNAVEFMPWTAWPGGEFSWGYDPFAFFSVEHRYYNDPAEPLDKLFRLQRLINEFHDRGIHVIMDGVFNHVRAGTSPDRGFPYSWLYHFPGDSPFVGIFEGGGFFEDLDYGNGCTNQFIVDACKYWIDEYKIDGIRFDYARGFDRPAGPPVGISRVVQDLNAYAAGQGLQNLSFTLELLPDNRYEAVRRTNQIRAQGCWFDPLMYQVFDAVRSGHLGTRLVRALDAGKDFEAGRGPVTYVENHDHSTLTEQAGGRDLWWRTQPAAIALLTCAGAPMLHNGQEYGEQYGFPEEGDQRVRPRPLRWSQSGDAVGERLRSLYRRLIAIRKAHPGLRSPNFYPDPYDESHTRFDAKGYGINEEKNVAVYHRWGDDGQGRLERFIVALNFSAFDQMVDIPFSVDGAWEDLLNGGTAEVRGFQLRNQTLGSHWGRVYFRRD